MKKDKKPMPEWLQVTLIIGGLFLFVIITSTVDYLAMIHTAGTEDAYVPDDIAFMLKMREIMEEHFTEQQINIIGAVNLALLVIIIGGAIIAAIITIIKEKREQRNGSNTR